MSAIDHKASAHRQLLRGIGGLGIGLIVFNSMMGAGIFALPATVSAAVGNFSPWLFVILGLLFMSVVLTFAELASYFRETGGPVLYTATAFGSTVGFSTGWVLYISRATAFAANVVVMSTYAGGFWPWLAEGIGRGLFITAIVALLTYVNFRGVRDGIWALLAFSFLKLTPLLLLVLAGIADIDPSVLPASLPSLSDLGGVSLLVIYAFVGFESATVVSGETQRPRESMPWSILGTVAGVALFYFCLVLVYTAVVPSGQQASGSLIRLGNLLLGNWGGTLIAIAAIFSIGGNLAAILLAASRITFALGEQGMLPAWFSAVHPRYGTPGNSILLLGALGLVLALSGSFVVLAVASSLTRLLTYLLCFASLPAIRRQASREDAASGFGLPGGYTIPSIASFLCLWMISHSTASAWLITGGMLAIGLVVYGLSTWSAKSTD